MSESWPDAIETVGSPPDVGTFHYVGFSSDWLGVVVGAVERLQEREFWAAETDEEIDEHLQQLQHLAWMIQTGMTVIESDETLFARDVKAQGSHGGTFTSGAWRTRDIAFGYSSIPSSNVVDNQISLPAGRYFVRVTAAAFSVAIHRLRLFDTLTDTALAVSLNINAPANYQSLAVIEAVVRLDSNAVLEVQHRCTTSRNTDGFGVASNLADEIYATFYAKRLRE